MNKISQNTKLTIQVILSVILVITGITLLFLGFYTQPPGEIHDSVLVAYGETSTFSGALMGIDYTYRYKVFMADKKTDRTEDGE